MLNTEERIPYACRACRDIRLVWSGHKEIPCPSCSGLCDEDREARIRAASAERLPKPGIVLLDLTPEEFETYRELLRANPSAHKLTVLSWVEGLRYHPAEDPEFLALVEERMAKWRRRSMAWDGIEPEWVRRYRAGDPFEGYEREIALLEEIEAANPSGPHATPTIPCPGRSVPQAGRSGEGVSTHLATHERTHLKRAPVTSTGHP